MIDEQGLLAALNNKLHDMMSDSRAQQSKQGLTPTGYAAGEGYRKAVTELQSFLYALSFPTPKEEDKE